MFKIYTKDDCPWCDLAKDLLKRKGHNFKELKLGIDFTREELASILPAKLKLTVPQVFLNDTRIGGYENLKDYFFE